MASLTLKDVPEPLLERLRERARSDRRSLSQEALFLLETALARRRDLRGDEQSDAWSRLAGRWRAEESVEEEIERILARRSGGRDVIL